MKKRNIVMMMCATALLSSCHIYKAYDRPEDISAEGIYRDPVSVTDTLAVRIQRISEVFPGRKFSVTRSCKY